MPILVVTSSWWVAWLDRARLRSGPVLREAGRADVVSSRANASGRTWGTEDSRLAVTGNDRLFGPSLLWDGQAAWASAATTPTPFAKADPSVILADDRNRAR